MKPAKSGKGREIAAYRNRARPWGKSRKQTRPATRRAAIKEGALPMSSNYPPGVTGREYEISGPEREWDETRACHSTKCNGTQRLFGMQAYAGEVWGTCDTCGEVSEFYEDDNDDDPPEYEDEPIEEYDPGPQVDDEGGMSEEPMFEVIGEMSYNPETDELA